MGESSQQFRCVLWAWLCPQLLFDLVRRIPVRRIVKKNMVWLRSESGRFQTASNGHDLRQPVQPMDDLIDQPPCSLCKISSICGASKGSSTVTISHTMSRLTPK